MKWWENDDDAGFELILGVVAFILCLIFGAPSGVTLSVVGFFFILIIAKAV